MGNSVTCCFKTAITVQQKDGSIKYYRPPVCAMDILKDQPDNIVVSIIKGKTNILASDLYLLPGCKYHIVSPDILLSTTCPRKSPAPSNAVIRRPRNPTIPRKPIGSPRNHKIAKPNRQPQHKPRALPSTEDPGSTLQSRLTTAAAETDPAGPPPTLGAALRSNSFKNAKTPEIGHQATPEPNAKVPSSPLRSKMTQPGKKPVTPTRPRNYTKAANTTTANAKLDVAVEQPKRKSFNGATRKSPGKSMIKTQAIRLSKEFSKEKRLQDMIKGADSQWKRILKSEHALMMEGNDSSSDSSRHLGQPAQCLPFRSPFKSFGQKDREAGPAFESEFGQHDHQSPLSQLRGNLTPRRTPGRESCGHAVLDDRQLKQADDRRRDLQQMLRFQRSLQRRDEAQGDAARRAAYEEMEESLEFYESPPKSDLEPLRRKIDAMEHEFLLSPSPRMASSQGRSVFLHKLAGDDCTMREFPNFSTVDRG